MQSVNTKVVQCAVASWMLTICIYATWLWAVDNNVTYAVTGTAMTLLAPIGLMWLTTLSKSPPEVLGNLTFTGLMIALMALMFYGNIEVKNPMMLFGGFGVMLVAALNAVFRDVDEMTSKPFLLVAFTIEALFVGLTLYWLTPAPTH